ncbi:hypothetical protein [Pleionea sediminis]|uniref:hypothetical protein n=1 Tax=Pleionea sediminis TaxID=2569479 RepID=UPI001184AEE1|nr:hypothetical protein [Pleionea sediminis]
MLVAIYFRCFRHYVVNESFVVERFYDDIERSKTDDFEYYFDVAKAVQLIKFIELLPHVKGKWANSKRLAKRIQLEG